MPIDVSLCHVLIDLSLRHMLTDVSLCHMVTDVSCHVSTDMLLCHWLTLVCHCWTEGNRLDNVCVIIQYSTDRGNFWRCFCVGVIAVS